MRHLDNWNCKAYTDTSYRFKWKRFRHTAISGFEYDTHTKKNRNVKVGRAKEGEVERKKEE